MPRILIIIILFSLGLTACKSNQKNTELRKIYLVRHAEKLTDDKNPSLSPAGIARAASLSEVLKTAQVDAIYSTDYKRTQETAQPTADRLNLSINSYDPRKLEEFATTISTELEGHLLVVGHSNTTPILVNHIIGEDKYPQLDESEYGDLYIVTLQGETPTVELSSF